MKEIKGDAKGCLKEAMELVYNAVKDDPRHKDYPLATIGRMTANKMQELLNEGDTDHLWEVSLESTLAVVKCSKVKS